MVTERRASGRAVLAIVPLFALALLAPALLNGFPLIFPDSGTYLGIAFGQDYAIDRSSTYGQLLKPLVARGSGTQGLWLGIAAQALCVAAIVVAALRHLALTPRAIALVSLLLVLLTALPWHAGQYMPDAFTGPLVLLTWLAASRDPGARGTPLLWLAAAVLATLHYTHLVLLPATAAATLAASGLAARRWRPLWPRAIAALLALALAVGALIMSNTAALSRRAISPTGPFFLFARLYEDGLIQPWLDRHCGRDAPAPLCALRPQLPRDSQVQLWGGARSPLGLRVWQPDDALRWRWMGMLARANRGAIAERPLAFVRAGLAGTGAQLVHFAAIDDECPAGCGDRVGGIGFVLARNRPAALPALDASMQRRGTTPKALLRAVSTPLAAAALLALPLLGIAAWRRRDAPALALIAALAVSLVANAALAGTLSDVHDRYQSRLVWLAPLALAALPLRWRRRAALTEPAGAG